MTHLKNILLSTLFITSFSFGQKPSFGIKAGLILSNATIERANFSGNNLRDNTTTRTSIAGGLYLNVPSGKKLIFRPGIEVVSKGARTKDDYSSIGYAIKFTYIEFPISFLYKINYTRGHLIIGGGPSIGVPIRDIYNEYPLKTEFGLNGLIGYELVSGFSLNLNYSHGLSNASKQSEYIKKISNRYAGIAVGYSF